jgi:hypothetical protein
MSPARRRNSDRHTRANEMGEGPTSAALAPAGEQRPDDRAPYEDLQSAARTPRIETLVT